MNRVIHITHMARKKKLLVFIRHFTSYSYLLKSLSVVSYW